MGKFLSSEYGSFQTQKMLIECKLAALNIALALQL